MQSGAAEQQSVAELSAVQHDEAEDESLALSQVETMRDLPRGSDRG